MKPLLLCGALYAISALPALAQGRAPGQNNGAVFQLPPSVKNVVSIDAQNLLIIESETNGQTQYTTQVVKHVYSGGIAQLFGGSIVPTAVFVSPAGATMFQNQNQGTGVTQAGGAGVGGTGFGGGGFGGGNNFNGGGDAGVGDAGGGFVNNAITRGNFTGNGSFSSGLFNGTLVTSGGVTNLQIRPR